LYRSIIRVKFSCLQAGVKSLSKQRLIKFSADENELRAPSAIAPRPQRTGINDHVHALNDEALLGALEIQKSL
jgi:hypothetical protein